MKNTMSLSILGTSLTKLLFALPCVAVLGISTTTYSAQADSTFSFGDLEPTVPPISTSVFRNGSVIGGTQKLDGINCTDCIFKDMRITYSGGGYRLINPRFENVSIEFKGAADNTLKLLDFILKANSPRSSKPIPNPELNPKVPIKITISNTDLISHEGEK